MRDSSYTYVRTRGSRISSRFKVILISHEVHQNRWQRRKIHIGKNIPTFPIVAIKKSHAIFLSLFINRLHIPKNSTFRWWSVLTHFFCLTSCYKRTIFIPGEQKISIHLRANFEISPATGAKAACGALYDNG